jgi:hypothetical protein
VIYAVMETKQPRAELEGEAKNGMEMGRGFVM